MKPTIVILVLAVLVFSVEGAQKCRCVRARKDDTTRYSGNLESIYKETKPLRLLRGVAYDPLGEVMPDALVEVFHSPEYLLSDHPEREAKRKPQRRLAACVTDKNGMFCLSNIPSGKYELRVSKGSGWNVTHVYVVVRKTGRSASNRQLKVEMSLGI